MPDRQEIVKKVTASLVDALSVDDDEVSLESSLTRDLGAESIDFLDIIFRLEKEFGMKIPRGDLIPEDMTTKPAYAKDGRLTDEGLQELQKRLPYADLTEFSKNPVISNMPDIFTVEMIVKYIEQRLS